MEHRFGNPLDLRKLKANVLKDLPAQARYWKKYAQKAASLTQEVKACPVCGGEATKEAAVMHGFKFVQCQNCTNVFNTQRIKEEERTRLYEETQSEINYSDTYAEDEGIQKYRLEKVASPRVEYIGKYAAKPPASWLDLATGNGDIVYAAKNSGYTAYGVDPSPACLEYAKKHYGIALIQNTIEGFEPEEGQLFDIVSLLGIADLLTDPPGLVKKTASFLKKGGIFAISFPHFNSFSTTVQKAFNDQIIRHMFPTVQNTYTFQSANRVLEHAGLEPVAAWWFGMDIYELAYNVYLLQTPQRAGALYEKLFENMNELQQVIDNKQQSDEFLIVAKKN